jgi:hypothetical protein
MYKLKAFFTTKSMKTTKLSFASSQVPETVKVFGLRDLPRRTQTTARTGNDPVISLHSPHPCGLCRRYDPKDGGGRIASGTAIESTNSRRSRRCRSSCREHGVFKTLNQHGYFLRVLRVLCGELSFLLDLDNTFTVSRDWEPAVFLSVKCRVPDNFLQNKLALLS